MRCVYVKIHKSLIKYEVGLSFLFFFLPIVMKKKAPVLWDTGQLLGSHFGAVGHSGCSGQSRIEQKNSHIPKIVPQLPAALELVSVYSTAFS